MARYLSFLLALTLIACSQAELPGFWRCEGSSSQVLRSDNGQELERYTGNSLVLLESFRGTVTQYISIPFTGVYQTCINSADTLAFSLGSCEPLLIYRKGSLDKRTGELIFSEIQSNSRGIITNEGKFQCEYLGHSYSADVFYGPKK